MRRPPGLYSRPRHVCLGCSSRGWRWPCQVSPETLFLCIHSCLKSHEHSSITTRLKTTRIVTHDIYLDVLFIFPKGGQHATPTLVWCAPWPKCPRMDHLWRCWGFDGLTLCRDTLWVRTVQRPCRVSTDCWWSRVGTHRSGTHRPKEGKYKGCIVLGSKFEDSSILDTSSYSI